MGTDVSNLKRKMEYSTAEKILTKVDITSSATCENCKNDPCLEGKPVT